MGAGKRCGSLPGEVDPRKPLSERRQACNYLKAAQSAATQIKVGLLVIRRGRIYASSGRG